MNYLTYSGYLYLEIILYYKYFISLNSLKILCYRQLFKQHKHVSHYAYLWVFFPITMCQSPMSCCSLFARMSWFSNSSTQVSCGFLCTHPCALLTGNSISNHRVDSYREFISLQNYALNYLSWNFCEMTMNDNKPILENLVVVR